MVSTLFRTLGAAALALSASSVAALAQTYPPPPGGGGQNPICQRLEAQLASIDRGASDPGRADQIKRYEDAANRQQFELDKTVAQSRRMGCENIGFFLFGGQPAQCGPLNNQIQQMRDNLDRILAELQKLQGAGVNYERDGQRRAILAALGRNDCGPQYRTAAQPPQPRGFFDTLFGSNSVFSPGPSQASTFRTICVRTCDGFYFPISFATTQDRFRDDEQQCQRMCPASEAMLFSHRNPGEEVAQAVSLGGRLYSELPNAFRYRQEYNPACSCKRAGETWADALKHLDDRTTLERGDILVTEERAKAMSQPRDAQGRPLRANAGATNTGTKSDKSDTKAETGVSAAEKGSPADPSAATNGSTSTAEPAKRPVRTVGPQLFPPVR